MEVLSVLLETKKPVAETSRRTFFVSFFFCSCYCRQPFPNVQWYNRATEVYLKRQDLLLFRVPGHSLRINDARFHAILQQLRRQDKPRKLFSCRLFRFQNIGSNQPQNFTGRATQPQNPLQEQNSVKNIYYTLVGLHGNLKGICNWTVSNFFHRKLPGCRENVTTSQKPHRS